MHPTQFDNASVVAKANVYFDGKVVSHTVLLAGGVRKTLGLIYPGTYKFSTDAPERMDITAGACRWRPAGQGQGQDAKDWSTCAAGEGFSVPGKSAFEIAVDELTQYICSFG
jgi:uncharacterized protein YaiE (UPF0345 family)